jgi:hypothetical protein
VAFVAGLKIDARLCGVLQREGQSEIFNRLGMIYAVWSIGLVGSIQFAVPVGSVFNYTESFVAAF